MFLPHNKRGAISTALQTRIHVYPDSTVSGVLILHEHSILYYELGASMHDMIDISVVITLQIQRGFESTVY